MKLALQAGGEIELASSDDISNIMDEKNNALYNALTSGLKYARSLDAVVSGANKHVSALLPNMAPNPGFVRSIRRISINTNDGGVGAYTGALYLNDPGSLGNFVYPFNMNLPGVITISDDALILNPDDELYLVTTAGESAAGTTYTVNCAYKEVEIDKLYLLDF